MWGERYFYMTKEDFHVILLAKMKLHSSNDKLDDVLPEKGFSKKASVELTRARLTQLKPKLLLKMPFLYIPRDSMRVIQNFWRRTENSRTVYGCWRPKNASTVNPIDEVQRELVPQPGYAGHDWQQLSFEIALYPYELVTYGETGSVCANWMQYRSLM